MTTVDHDFHGATTTQQMARFQTLRRKMKNVDICLSTDIFWLVASLLIKSKCFANGDYYLTFFSTTYFHSSHRLLQNLVIQNDLIWRSFYNDLIKMHGTKHKVTNIPSNYHHNCRSLKYPIDTLWFCPVFEQTMASIPSLRISLDSDLCVWS